MKVFFCDDVTSQNINKLNEFLLIIYNIMKNNPLVFNPEIIKLIEIKDMGMLHPSEQP